MARFTKILRDKGLRKLSSDKKVQQQVYKRSQEQFEAAKEKMLQDFIGHPVSKEIKAGPEAKNISNTIMGSGNLFSFIGFQSGADPIGDIYNLLSEGTYLSGAKPRVVKKTKNRIYLGFKVIIPTNTMLASVSKMPWEPGSWLFKIESGMSGLGHYIYEKYIKGSRSGTGIQAHGKIKSGAFQRVKYMSAILRTFKKNFANT